MKRLRLFVPLSCFLCALFLGIGQVASAPNSISRLGVLYQNGHPVTGEVGELYSMAASEAGFLFVSFYSLSNPQGAPSRELHTWDLRNPRDPKLIGRLDLSDPGDRADPDDSSFLVPRDMVVIKGHLTFWRNFELYTYRIGSDGSLTYRFKGDFADDLNSGLNRFARGGSMVASERQLLTNNEFLQLADQVGFDVAEDLVAERVLLSIQNPEAPFLVRQTQGIGDNYRIFDPAPNGSFRGLPARIDVDDEDAQLSVVTLTQAQESHLEQFWTPVLRQTFRRAFLDRSLRSLATLAVRTTRPRDLTLALNGRIRRAFGFAQDRTLSTHLGTLLEENALLSATLAQFNIAPDDSVRFAVEKVFDQLISANLEKNLNDFLGRQLLDKLLEVLLPRVPRTARELARRAQSAFDERLERLGVDRYLVNVVLSPLVEVPPVLRKTLRQLIRDLAQSNLGNGVTSALGVFHQFVPIRAAFRAARIEVPRCYTLPETANEFLRVLVTSGGPELRLDNLALFEFVKLAAHYRGNTNYGKLVGNIRAAIRTLHRDLSSDLIVTFLRTLDVGAGLSTSTAQILSKAQTTISIRPSIVRALAARVVEQLATAGVDVNGTVRAALEAQGMYLEVQRLPDGMSLATNAELIAATDLLGVGAQTLGSLVRIDLNAGRNSLTEELEGAAGRLFERLFGVHSLDQTLSQALLNMISRSVKPQPLADFVEDVLGSALSDLERAIPLPSVIDTAVRAARGNCIATYQLALVALSPTPIVGEASLLAHAALVEAQELALEFITQQLLQNFLSQIFDSAGEHYPSWNLKLLTSTASVQISDLTDRSVRFIDAFIERGRAGVLLRDLNGAGWDPSLSREVDIVTFDPSDIAGTRSTISLGAWDAVRGFVSNPLGYLLVVGDKLDVRAFPQSTVVLANISEPGSPILELTGDSVSTLGSANQLEVFGTLRLFAVRDAGGTITLLGRAVGNR